MQWVGWDSNPTSAGDISSSTPNEVLRDLRVFRRFYLRFIKRFFPAQIEFNGKSLTFHCFRKTFLSGSIDSEIGLTAGKKLCGKAIPKSDNTYLTTVQLRPKFIQLKKFLTIKQIVKPENHETIETLKSIVTNLHEDLTQQKIITQTVTEENLNIKQDLEALKERLNTITKSRKESDEIMNRLFENPEFQQMIRMKIKEMRL